LSLNKKVASIVRITDRYGDFVFVAATRGNRCINPSSFASFVGFFSSNLVIPAESDLPNLKQAKHQDI
jgi:hypothetical protein